MKKYKIAIFFLLAFAPSCLNASTLTLSPPGGTIKAGEAFEVKIFAEPSGETLDTVRARINFSKDLLEIQSFSLSSKFSYQAGGNDLGNQSGQFSWGAGVAGGVNQSSTFGTIVFKAKKEGQAVVSVSPDSMVLSAGQNSFESAPEAAVYEISPAIVQPPPAQTKDLKASVLPKSTPKNIESQKPAATSTNSAEDTFLSLSTGPESQNAVFPGQPAEADVFPYIEESGPEEPSGFNRTNKIILAAMILALFLIGLAIYRLKEKEIKI